MYEAVTTPRPESALAAQPSPAPGPEHVALDRAAAAVLAVGGTAWGLVSSGGAPVATTAGLTAVTGCPGLAVTSGTLEQLSGTRLVVKTRDGHHVTVHASGSTAVSVEERGSLSDIADSARVLVTSDPAKTTPTTLVARKILVNLGQSMPQPVRPGAMPRCRSGQASFWCSGAGL